MPARRRPASQPTAATLSVHPMELRLGDRLTEDGEEWEVSELPATYAGGKSVRARIQRPGRPETEREMIWPAHEKLAVRRLGAG